MADLKKGDKVWYLIQAVPGQNDKWIPREGYVLSVGTRTVHLLNGAPDLEIKYCFRTEEACLPRCAMLFYIFTGQPPEHAPA